MKVKKVKMNLRTLYFGLALLNTLLAAIQAYKVICDPTLGVVVHVVITCFSMFAVGCCFTAGVFAGDN